MNIKKFLEQFAEWRPTHNEWFENKVSEDVNTNFPYRCLHCYQPMKDHGFCSLDCTEAHADMVAEAEATGN